MKILYFLDFPFNIGGSNKVLLTQAYIMGQKGNQVRVVIPDNEEGEHSPEYDSICASYQLEKETVCYHVYNCLEAIDIFVTFREYESILQLIKAYEPDMIHGTQLNIGVELAARELRIPHLMNIYPADWQTFHLDWMKIYPVYHSADSLMMSERWEKGLEIHSKCIRVAYMLKEKTGQKKQNKTDKTVLNIISIGAVYELKNQMEIIKFIHMCKENGHNVRLWILGDCSRAYAQKCKDYVAENGLTDCIYFMGFVPKVEECLRNADLFVLASTVESFPGVIVESMANKIPIISTAVAGVPEVLQDSVNGFLTEGYMAKDIYRAFLRYLEYRKSGRISDIIDNAYATYLQYHTYEKIGEELEDYCRWIIKDYKDNKADFITVKAAKTVFDNFVLEKNIDKTNQRLMRNIWFLYHIFPVLEKSEKIVIWGAGMWGSIVLDWLSDFGLETKVLGFMDTKKQGIYLNHTILNDVKAVVAQCDSVLVAVADAKAIVEIMDCLEQYSLQRNRDYFLLFNMPFRI